MSVTYVLSIKYYPCLEIVPPLMLFPTLQTSQFSIGQGLGQTFFHRHQQGTKQSIIWTKVNCLHNFEL
jgi:hypothetical protein